MNIKDLPKGLIEASKKVLEERYDHKLDTIVVVRGDKQVELAQNVIANEKLKGISIKRQVKKPNIGNIVTFEGDKRQLQKLHKELTTKDKGLNKYILTFESVSEGSEEYKAFFNAALKKFGVSSPADFDSEEKKKEFFDYIDKNYKGEKEED
jgi:hypothetical protein